MKKLILGIFVLHLLALASTTIIYETQQDISYTPQNVSSPFTIPLNCDSSFDISVSVPSGQQAVCTAYPAQIVSQAQWSGSIPVVGGSFDNILYYDVYGLYFALDTKSWRILAASNMADPTTYKYIEVSTSVVYQNNNDEIPFLVIDTDHKLLYILRTDMAAYYDLVAFHTAYQAGTTIPKLTNSITQPEYKPKDTLKGAKYYYGNLHLIIEDNDLEIWTTSSSGSLVLNSIAFDSTFFNVTNTEDITDIVFKDNYAFILDEMYGVYVVKMTQGTTTTYTNMDAFKINLMDARLIEVTGDSLNIITMNKRETVLYEYLVTTSPSLTITFNRQINLRDALRDSYSDTNFLYFLTGFQNVAAKHSIPGTYDDATIENYYKSYWPMSDIGAITSVVDDSSSTVVVINGTVVTVYNVYETSGTLVCPAGKYKTGSYVYTVTSMQRTCNAKTTSNTADVCQVKQKVTINVNDAVSQPADDDDKTGLIVGLVIAFLTVVALVFAYWWFKVRGKDDGGIVKNNVFFRRLSRSPLNNDASNMYKVTMDANRSEAKDDHVGERRKSDDFVLGIQKSDDLEDSPSPQKAAIVRGKTFSEFDKPRNPIDVPKTNTISNIEGTRKSYEGDI